MSKKHNRIFINVSRLESIKCKFKCRAPNMPSLGSYSRNLSRETRVGTIRYIVQHRWEIPQLNSTYLGHVSTITNHVCVCVRCELPLPAGRKYAKRALRVTLPLHTEMKYGLSSSSQSRAPSLPEALPEGTFSMNTTQHIPRFKPPSVEVSSSRHKSEFTIPQSNHNYVRAIRVNLSAQGTTREPPQFIIRSCIRVWHESRIRSRIIHLE